MTDLIERAAIALYTHQAWAVGGYALWQSVPRTVKDAYRKWALDVVRALREPTDVMLEAGAKVCGDERGNPDELSARSCWETMMDAGIAQAPEAKQAA